MRYDECLITRPDMVDEVPGGLVPRWMRDLPVPETLEMLELRRRGFTLLGLQPGDDVDDLFAD